MPVYSYQCDNCGVRFERTQRFSDPPVKRCPECRKNRVRRLLHATGVVFKGSGWYATDHRSASGAGRSGKDKQDKADSAEAKPADEVGKAADKKEGKTSSAEGE